MEFKNIVGHEKQKKMLLSFLLNERFPHALLFSGQEGIGKKRIALALSKQILCKNGDGCGVCHSCVKVERMTHPDLMLIDRQYIEWVSQSQRRKTHPEKTDKEKETTSIGIDLIRGSRGSEEKKIRGINQEVHEFPYEGTKRVIIIDDAHRMTNEATNALLKTLEEPPEFNIFFLITSSEKDLPLTIRSRCTRVVFSPLTHDTLMQYFVEALGIEEKKAATLSFISNGSIGNGLFWLEGENMKFRQKLGELILGRNKSFLNISLLSEQVAREERESSIYIFFLLSLFRDLYIIKNKNGSAGIINRDLRELLERTTADNEWIDRSIQKIQETIGIMKYNINHWLMFENLILQIMR